MFFLAFAPALILPAQPSFLETFNDETKATLTDQGWGFFPNSGFSVSNNGAYDEEYLLSNAGIGQNEYLLTPCLSFSEPFDTLTMLYRTSNNAQGFVSLGYQRYDDPVGQNVIWVDTLTPNNQWTPISVPYEPPVWPYLCRIVFGFGTLEAGGKVGLENFASLHASDYGPCEVLPMQSLTMNAHLTDDRLGLNGPNVTIIWQAERETDFDHYRIMRSTDGYDFDLIGSTDAVGAGSYEFVDDMALEGTVYYRVGAVGYDGSITYSTVVPVEVPGSNLLVVNDAGVQYLGDETSQLGLFTVSGQLVWQGAVEPQQVVELDWNTGHYVALVNGSNESRSLIYVP